MLLRQVSLSGRYLRCEAKVNKLQSFVNVAFLDEDEVLWFDISMYNSFRVEVD